MKNETENEVGTLELGEPHPMARSALNWIRDWVKRNGVTNTLIMTESMASCAIAGNRSAEVCGETFRRIMESSPVSDRYVLGLAWFLRDMEEIDNEPKKGRKKS